MFSIERTTDKKSQTISTLVRTSERNIGSLQTVMAGYLRNQERLRKKSVKMSGLVKAFASMETPQFGEMLACFAEMLIEREKERDKMIERIQVLSEEMLKVYPALCHKLKEELRTRDAALEKEAKKQQQLDKVLTKESGNRPKISQSQMELAGASHEVAHATGSVLESTARFEVKKREDIQSCFREFLWSEIQFHASSLEIASHYHKLLAEYSFGDDAEDIQAKLESTSPTTPTTPRSR
ncbi:FAM92 protein [Zopfochytrium polystomum]|nr:FAM92 protein [Zopfochytrium polystomum]